MAKEKVQAEKENYINMNENVFLEKLECITGLCIEGGIPSPYKETPFFIIEDLIKLRRMKIKGEEAES